MTEIIIVKEPGIRGPSPQFKLENGKMICLNYPGSSKPMTIGKFVEYVIGVNKRLNNELNIIRLEEIKNGKK